MSLLVRYLPLLLALAAWEGASRLGLISQGLLPGLSEVVERWAYLMFSSDLLYHLGVSLYREAAGFLLSVVIGIALGVAMAWSLRVRECLEPLVTLTYPVPKSALIPILIVWLGIGHTSKVAVIFLGCLLPMVISTYHGARGVDPHLLWVGRNLRMPALRLLTRIVLPAALPDILSGMRIALAGSFVLLVSSELLIARAGLGFLISFLGEAGEYASMFAAILTVAGLGFAADRAFQYGMHRVLRWQQGPA
ncbi:MAG: ABC transporter permease [Deltaproteobacteria bacterium]|nr:ABC transporter permease [Deltaproteobacteria bacterium]